MESSVQFHFIQSKIESIDSILIKFKKEKKKLEKEIENALTENNHKCVRDFLPLVSYVFD